MRTRVQLVRGVKGSPAARPGTQRELLEGAEG